MTKSLNTGKVPIAKPKKNRTSLHRTLRLHNTPPKELTNNTKPIFRPLQLSLEKIMLIRRFDLSLPNSLDGGVLRCADRAFSVFVNLV